MTRSQKVMTIIALAFCFAGAVAGEIWQASNPPHVAVNQSATSQKENGTNPESPKESAEEAIARYNKWLTIFTAILAVATVGLGFATVGLYFTSAQQIKLSRNEFLATHRPLLRVRYFKRLDAGNTQPPQVGFTVVNVGKTPAYLLGSSVQIALLGQRLPTPVYINGQDVTGRRRFAPGASDEYQVSSAAQKAAFQWLYVYGYLVYSDDAGNTRTTAFCRKWIPSDDRFVGVDDADYEYED
jgi:hypothetical protein